VLGAREAGPELLRSLLPLPPLGSTLLTPGCTVCLPTPPGGDAYKFHSPPSSRQQVFGNATTIPPSWRDRYYLLAHTGVHQHTRTTHYALCCTHRHTPRLRRQAAKDAHAYADYGENGAGGLQLQRTRMAGRTAYNRCASIRRTNRSSLLPLPVSDFSLCAFRN